MCLKRILRDLLCNPLLLKGEYSGGEEKTATGLGWGRVEGLENAAHRRGREPGVRGLCFKMKT